MAEIGGQGRDPFGGVALAGRLGKPLAGLPGATAKFERLGEAPRRRSAQPFEKVPPIAGDLARRVRRKAEDAAKAVGPRGGSDALPRQHRVELDRKQRAQIAQAARRLGAADEW